MIFHSSTFERRKIWYSPSVSMFRHLNYAFVLRNKDFLVFLSFKTCTTSTCRIQMLISSSADDIKRRFLPRIQRWKRSIQIYSANRWNWKSKQISVRIWELGWFDDNSCSDGLIHGALCEWNLRSLWLMGEIRKGVDFVGGCLLMPCED